MTERLKRWTSARLASVCSGALRSGHTLGGQAVMEGVMIRSRERLAIAIRKPDGSILVEVRPWFSLTDAGWLKKPFLRGFPVLLETMVNGIKALNFSAEHAMAEETGETPGESGESTGWAIALALLVSIGLALGLFVAAPHLMTLALTWLGVAGDMDSLSFHVWDGIFKLLIFVGYIAAISLMPDVRRVFEYHGAEHKAIWAFENKKDLTPQAAEDFSRLHPRCGTTFLLFVLSAGIVIHAAAIPALLALWAPQSGIWKQVYVIGVKLLLMVPISAVAFELIKLSGRFASTSRLGAALCWPGMVLQTLTTKEPDEAQLEVAFAALKGALGEEP